MQTIYISAVIAFLCFILPAVIGLFLAKEHSVTRTAWFNNEPSQIWELLTDFTLQKNWRTDLKKIEKLPDHKGADAWKETSKNGQSMQLSATITEPQKELIRTIINSKAFGGNWVIRLIPENQGCSVQITENGFINNPGMRFIFRLFLSPNSSIDKYLKMLGTHLGQNIEPK